MHLHQLKSDRCVWVKKNIIVLVYVDDLFIAGTSSDTTPFLFAFWESASADIQACDITVSLERFYYYTVLKTMDLNDSNNPTSTPSLRRPPAQQDSHLDPDRHHIYCKVVGMLIWAAQVRPDLQLTAKEWGWQHLKRTLRHLKGTMHYKFFTSPQLPQSHSLPLRQVIPLHINTYCDSEWATDIDSQVNYFKGFNIIFNNLPSTSATSTLSTTLPSSLTTKPLTSSKLPIHIFTSNTSAPSLSNKLGLNKRSKHIALRYLFVEDIQVPREPFPAS